MLTVDDKGNIFLVQGDTGTLVIDGLDPDEEVTYYFGIRDRQRAQIGDEIAVEANGTSSITFNLTAELTDQLTVPTRARREIYFWGLKKCSTEDNTEDTCIVDGGDIGTVNTITVYPKKVEGI